MEQKAIHEITRKSDFYTVSYILNFEKTWNEAVELIKRSGRDLSKIMITKKR